MFIRRGFTADTNAMAVGFLESFAEAEMAVGNATGAAALTLLAERVKAAMNDKLWAHRSAGDDHYVTQLNRDGGNGSTAKFFTMLCASPYSAAFMRRHTACCLYVCALFRLCRCARFRRL